eukprot:CAMPEP_0198724960 /NCGR_PEP_ID=MMETSP1475-20131203/2338_1 /TAXON_ID= ORGANISM="Unidentified sp., Strain CCMP1999" /NCGR_SAMPLE_ID=MMETSP1475 /ASSEMBLY_ACC=CAM_ASM_001111 /LENGTH=214 /DNA_ID=CAMNT_0044486611 /DNA_START=1 /DNA_END=646 /DNA_ORIENTATION=+
MFVSVEEVLLAAEQGLEEAVDGAHSGAGGEATMGKGARMRAFNVKKFVEENREHFKPPVGNKLLFANEFKVMIVAGPNSRTDYHMEAGEEWFYQLEGGMTLKVDDGGDFYDIRIEEGDTFCLGPNIPHSPQRDPGSIGIVLERERKENEEDRMRWYCQECRSVVYEETFHCKDLVKDLPPIMEHYWGSEENRTCGKCGWREEKRIPAQDVESHK